MVHSGKMRKGLKRKCRWQTRRLAMSRLTGCQIKALERKARGAVSECVFGPHAALAKKPEMLMYNMYTPLSELFVALPANQIHHSDTAPCAQVLIFC